MTMSDPRLSAATSLAERLKASGVFARVEVEEGAVRAYALHVESPAWYALSWDEAGDCAWVGLYTPDRWLSESIEAELMHRGDKLEELLEEELIDQGYATPLTVEHFRDEDRHYVFRSSVAVGDDPASSVERMTQVALAYEACFSRLGDMAAKDDAAS